MKPVVALVAILIASGVGYTVWPRQTDVAAPVLAPGLDDLALVDVRLPQVLSENAQVGKTGFEAKCAVCHGRNAAGQDGVAPPLVHVIYEPSHHGDDSFQRAAAQGVRGHHWPFGDMPPVEGVTPADITMIVAYIRELQQANGIN